ncbi:MAG: Gfo/Idh/MocA family oxidoreductase [Bacteroidales bacterium]|nr:Gfo/Idh/MocA family oxidoreductase [Bacteroidales bacterium]MCM1414528.1 Gfo/Idh/MocA family oxidoreductase [bacterium]MCM1422578.1 Gfo/Idh/MocA family oxidoreductase [bacterium]
MKILFIGLGSAGQRHLRNLKRILGNDVEFLAYRVRKYARLFDDNLNVVEGQNVKEAYHIQEFDKLDEALREKPDAAFICNPNSMHIEVALQVAREGIDIFLEKPVSDSLERLDELGDLIDRNKIILYVGYQMRLHPCLIRLKQDIDEKRIGEIVSVDCQMGELISQMHKYEDYRDMNEAKKATGGGVVLCQIHELDYLCWIFGMPTEVYSIGGKYSDLEIEVEDGVTTICRYTKENSDFPIMIHQDFLQTPPVRKCKVIGTLGQIEVDLLQNQYVVYDKQTVREEKFVNFSRNDMFMEEVKRFLEYVKTRKQETLTLEEGTKSLKVALAIKESMAVGHSVPID